MTRIVKILTSLCLLAGLTAPATAQELRIGLRPVPPYVMTGADGRFLGLEHDVIAEALRRVGVKMDVHLYPLSRLVYAYDGLKEVDAAAPMIPSFNVDGTLSKSYLRYRNIIATMKSRNIPMVGLESFGGLKMMAFQNARTVLGQEFQMAVMKAASYAEQANQDLQLLNLLAGRVDAIVGEQRIFQYYYSAANPHGPSYHDVVMETPVGAETAYSVAFRDASLARRFDIALDAMTADGTLAEMHKQYNQLLPIN
ncbi:substrate-binding periplasmic protein [Lacibacterium aquatile]|uniref:Substrate-binding periplasmic protein n=1 Tax=Lacibacterium aquatile TaxID=1168082 RepID=A0ABW5DWY4_9PROT